MIIASTFFKSNDCQQDDDRNHEEHDERKTSKDDHVRPLPLQLILRGLIAVQASGDGLDTIPASMTPPDPQRY
jgi:hypothetical protein